MLTIAVLAVLAGPSWAASQHQVTDKDHLWGLAGRYYGNNFCWRAIYEANKDAIKDPHWIYPRQSLAIPESPNCGAGADAATEASAPVTAPVEASAPIPAQAEEPATEAPAVVETPAPVTAPPAARSLPPLPKQTEESLMQNIPKGLSGSEVSTPRAEFPKDWKADGSVIEELLAEGEDEVLAKMRLDSVLPGTRFAVYRRAPALESDGDTKAVFVVKIAVVEALRQVKGGRYAFKIVRRGESIEQGDLLKLER
jgi:hypothetical protein